MLLLAIALSAWVNSGRRQQQAVAELGELAFSLRYDDGTTSIGWGCGLQGHIESRESVFRNWTNACLGRDYARNVDFLQLSRFPKPAEDRKLALLSAFPRLRYLSLKADRLTDVGMRYISGLRELRWLSIEDAPLVDDDAVACISDMSSLRMLRIVNASLTDDGLPAVAKLTELKGLSLLDTDVTDDGLVHLLHLRKLTDLALAGPSFDAVGPGLMRLQKVLPNVRLHRSKADQFGGAARRQRSTAKR
ncbi:MAG TPA: hypothetical protein VIK18_19880 [Pirellulales bacterium]